MAFASWNNSGGDQVEAYANSITGTMDPTKAADDFAKQQQQKYIDAYFDKASLTNASVSNTITRMSAANAKTLEYALLTDPSVSPANSEHYKVSYQLVPSTVKRLRNDDTSRTVSMTYKISSNYKKTSFKDKQTDAQDILYTNFIVTAMPEGTSEKITAVTEQDFSDSQYQSLNPPQP